MPLKILGDASGRTELFFDTLYICKFHHVSSVGTGFPVVKPKHASGLVHQRGILGYSNFFPTYIINQENDDRMWDFAPDLQNKIHISIYTSQFPKRFSCSSSSNKPSRYVAPAKIFVKLARMWMVVVRLLKPWSAWWPVMRGPRIGEEYSFLRHL